MSVEQQVRQLLMGREGREAGRDQQSLMIQSLPALLKNQKRPQKKKRLLDTIIFQMISFYLRRQRLWIRIKATLGDQV